MAKSSSSTKSSPQASFLSLLKRKDYKELQNNLNNPGILQAEHKGDLLIQHLVRAWVSNSDDTDLNGLIATIKGKNELFARNKAGANILFILADNECFEKFKQAFDVQNLELKNAIGQNTEELIKVATVRDPSLAAFLLNLSSEPQETKILDIIRMHQDASLKLVEMVVKQDSELSFINAAIEVKATKIVNYLLRSIEYSDEQLQKIAKKVVDSGKIDVIMSALESGKDLTRVNNEGYIIDYAFTQYLTNAGLHQTIEEFYKGELGNKSLIDIANKGDINALLGYCDANPQYTDKMRPAIETMVENGYFKLLSLMHHKFGDAIFNERDGKLIKKCDPTKIVPPKIADIMIQDYAKEKAFAVALERKDFDAAERMIAMKGNELDISGVNDDLIINAVYLEGAKEILTFLANHPQAKKLHELVDENGVSILALTKEPKSSSIYQLLINSYCKDQKEENKTMYDIIAGNVLLTTIFFRAVAGINIQEEHIGVTKQEIVVVALQAGNRKFLEQLKTVFDVDVTTHNFGTEEEPVSLYDFVVDGKKIYEHDIIASNFSAIILESLYRKYDQEVLNEAYRLGENSKDFALFDFVLQHVLADGSVSFDYALKRSIKTNNKEKMGDIAEKFSLDALDIFCADNNIDVRNLAYHHTQEGSNIFTIVAREASVEVMEALLKRNLQQSVLLLSENQDKETAISVAFKRAMAGDSEMFKYLRIKAPQAVRFFPFVIEAVKEYKIGFLKELKLTREELLARDASNNNVLHYIASNNSREQIEAIFAYTELNELAKQNPVNSRNESIVDIAARNHNVNFLKLMPKNDKLRNMFDLSIAAEDRELTNLVIEDYSQKNTFAEAVENLDLKMAKFVKEHTQITPEEINEDIVKTLFLNSEHQLLREVLSLRTDIVLHNLVNTNSELTGEDQEKTWEVLLESYTRNSGKNIATAIFDKPVDYSYVRLFLNRLSVEKQAELGFDLNHFMLDAIKHRDFASLGLIESARSVDISNYVFTQDGQNRKLHELIIDDKPIYEHEDITAEGAKVILKSYADDADPLEKAYNERDYEMFAFALDYASEEQKYKVLDQSVADDQKKYATTLVIDGELKLHNRKYLPVAIDGFKSIEPVLPFSMGKKWLYDLAMDSLIASYDGDEIKAYADLFSDRDIHHGIKIHEIDENHMPNKGSRLEQVMRTMFKNGPTDALLAIEISGIANFPYTNADVKMALDEKDNSELFSTRRTIILGSFAKQNKVSEGADILCAITTKLKEGEAVEILGLAMLSPKQKYDLNSAISNLADKGNYEAIAVIFKYANDMQQEVLQYILEKNTLKTAIESADTKLFDAIKPSLTKEQTAEFALVALENNNLTVFKEAISAENITTKLLNSIVYKKSINAIEIMKDKGMKQWLFPAFNEYVAEELQNFYNSCKDDQDNLLGLAKKYMKYQQEEFSDINEEPFDLSKELVNLDELDSFRYLCQIQHTDFINQPYLEELVENKSIEWHVAVKGILITEIDSFASVEVSPATRPSSDYSSAPSSEPSSLELGSPLSDGKFTSMVGKRSPGNPATTWQDIFLNAASSSAKALWGSVR